tara:strand:+ start:31 stop:474 length:444 start_codon:yes stop_codon:yes gene_type:complete
MKNLLIILFIGGALFSCSEPSDHIVPDFEDMKTDLDLIVKHLPTDPIYNSELNKFVRVNELSKESQELINRLDLNNVYYVILSTTSCSDANGFELEIVFEGDWHLCYSPCEVSFISPGEHKEMNDHFIESWGLDSNWYLWVNRDFIG